MNLRKLYEENADFQRYVNMYCQKHHISVEEAIQHVIVKNYAEVCWKGV